MFLGLLRGHSFSCRILIQHWQQDIIRLVVTLLGVDLSVSQADYLEAGQGLCDPGSRQREFYGSDAQSDRAVALEYGKQTGGNLAKLLGVRIDVDVESLGSSRLISLEFPIDGILGFAT